MQLRTLQQLKNLHGKAVLLRVDYNVSLGKNGKVDPWEEHRIDATLPTIELLLKRGAQVILLAHLGRPDGKVVEKLRLKPVARRLQQLLKSQITNYPPDFAWTKSRRAGKSQTNHKLPARLRMDEVQAGGQIPNSESKWLLPPYEIVPGRVWLLENLRFDPREEKDNLRFAKTLASLGDVYVNDAFAVSHRKNASVYAIMKYLPSYAGLLMEKEVAALSSVMDKPRRPLAVVMGGAKMSSKIGLIKKFARHADAVLLGGGIANTFLAAQGQKIGKSLYEPHMIGTARKLLRSKKILLPVDVVWSRNQILDIGPDTRQLYAALLQNAHSIVWNGPIGLIEEPRFAKGTWAIIDAVIKNKRARSVIGGGETITAFRQCVSRSTLHAPRSNIFLSTGGGAMLEFLERGILPGIEPLCI